MWPLLIVSSFFSSLYPFHAIASQSLKSQVFMIVILDTIAFLPGTHFPLGSPHDSKIVHALQCSSLHTTKLAHISGKTGKWLIRSTRLQRCKFDFHPCRVFPVELWRCSWCQGLFAWVLLNSIYLSGSSLRCRRYWQLYFFLVFEECFRFADRHMLQKVSQF